MEGDREESGGQGEQKGARVFRVEVGDWGARSEVRVREEGTEIVI